MQPGERFDRFEVQQTLGRGGIATVYRVRHTRLDTVLALKVLKIGDPGLQERLIQEGRIQAGLQHDHVVRVLDVVEDRGAVGLLMEYIDGFSLEQALREGPMELEDALDIFHQVLSGVAAAHARGVTHRDLKPGNILLTVRGDRVVAKVTDFGIAKVLADDGQPGMTRQGVAMGTPGYMAPEQIADSAGVDARTDIFALGAILYEMLSGARPFQGDTALAIMNATAAGTRVPLSERRPKLPARVTSAVDRCLSRAPRSRYQTVEELARALFDDGLDADARAALDPTGGFVPVGAVSGDGPRSNPTLAPGTLGEDLSASLDPPATGESTEEPTSETWLPAGVGESSPAESSPDDPVSETKDTDWRARFAAPPDDYEVVEEEVTSPVGRSAAAEETSQEVDAEGAVRGVEEIGAGAEGSEDDEEDESPVNASDAASMLGDLVWSFLRATAWGLGQTLRYGGLPIAIVLGIAWYQGSQAAAQLTELADLRSASAASLANAMDSSLRVVPEVVAAGGNADLLRSAQRQYETADTPEARAAAAQELASALGQELGRLPPPESDTDRLRRKELEGIVNRLEREAREYGEVEHQHSELSESTSGKLARWFGRR